MKQIGFRRAPAAAVSPDSTGTCRVAAWLAEPAEPQGEGVRARLLGLTFDRKSFIVFGSVSVAMIAGSAMLLTDALWPYAWLLLELGLLTVRLLLIRRCEQAAVRGETAPIGALMLSGGVWALAFGLGCGAAMTSGETVLAVLAALNVAASVAAVSTRNAGTPRFATLAMLAIAVPFAVGALLSPIPAMALAGIQAPIHVYGMLVLMRRNHDHLVRLFQAEAQSRQLARLDMLTGLPNRAALGEMLASLCASLAGGRRDDRFALLSLDLDGFKAVNDAHGHAAGDRLLALVADRLSRTIRDGDTAFRLGGDEFVVVLTRSGEDEARLVAGRIIEAVSKPYELLDGTKVSVGISVGSALAPGHATNAAALLSRSDQALYHAKRAGRGRHVLAATG